MHVYVPLCSYMVLYLSSWASRSPVMLFLIPPIVGIVKLFTLFFRHFSSEIIYSVILMAEIASLDKFLCLFLFLFCF